MGRPEGRTYTNFRLFPFWGCGQGFPLAILRLPGRPHGAGLRRSRSALAPGCQVVPAGLSGRLRGGGECSDHYHPLPHSVTCHVWPLTFPVRSRPLSKQTGTAQSRCSTRASAERERRRPPIGVWWGGGDCPHFFLMFVVNNASVCSCFTSQLLHFNIAKKISPYTNANLRFC